MTLFTRDDITRLSDKYQNRPQRRPTTDNIELTMTLIKMYLIEKRRRNHESISL